MQLLQSQKNQIFDMIEESGLSPVQFDFSVASDPEDETYLRLNNSTYYFNFATGNSGGHFARYSPGYDTPFEDQSPGSWSLQMAYVKRWLGYLKRELNTPDKWKLLEEELNNVDFGDTEFTDTKFTYQEYKSLETKISELKTKISKLDLLEEQIKKINSKLDHLLELAKDMNKSDWKDLFIGSLISLTMQLSIDRSVGTTIFNYLKDLFVKLLPGS